jgi:hypothetical protein
MTTVRQLIPNAFAALLLVSGSLALPKVAQAQVGLILVNPSTCENALLRGDTTLRYGGRVVDSRDTITVVNLTTKFSPQGGTPKRLPSTIYIGGKDFLGVAKTSPPQRWVEVNGSIGAQRIEGGRVLVGSATVNRANYPCNPQPPSSGG